MPHKWYAGKTGIVWNVTKRAVGVEINKIVSGCCSCKPAFYGSTRGLLMNDAVVLGL
jgi:ribosomal protein L21E